MTLGRETLPVQSEYTIRRKNPGRSRGEKEMGRSGLRAGRALPVLLGGRDLLPKLSDFLTQFPPLHARLVGAAKE